MARNQEDLTRLVVSLEARLKQFDSAMARASGTADKTTARIEARFRKMEKTLGEAGRNLFGGITAVAAIDAVAKAIDKLANIGEIAKRVNISTDALQALHEMAKRTGASVEQVDKALQSLAEQSATPDSFLAKLFQANGMSFDKNGETNLRRFMDLVKNAGGAEQQLALLTQVVGDKVGRELVEAFAAGGASIDTIFAEMTRKGTAHSGAQIQDAESIRDAYREVTGDIENLWENMVVILSKRIGLDGESIRLFGAEFENRIRTTIQEFEAIKKWLVPGEQSNNSDTLKSLEEQRATKMEQLAGAAAAGEPLRFINLRKAELAEIEKQIAALQRRNVVLSATEDHGVDRHAAGASSPITAGGTTKLPPSEEDKKAAAEKKALTKAIDDLILSTRREISALVDESEQTGQSIYEIQRLKKEKELLAKLDDAHREHGGVTTPEEIAQANALADAYGNISQAIADNQRKLSELRDYTDVVFGDMEQTLDQFVDTGKLSFKDLVVSILKDEAKLGIHKLLDLAENGQPGTGNGGLVGAMSKALGLNSSATTGTANITAGTVNVNSGLGGGLAAIAHPYRDQGAGAASANAVPVGAAPSAQQASAPNALLDLIGRAEGTDKGRGYNETLGYGAFTGGARNLTGMTLDQVRDLQRQMLANPANTFNSSALGRYQITGQTLDSLKTQLGLKGDELFDPAMQDRLAMTLAQRRGPDVAGLRNEWEGLRGVGGPDILGAYQQQMAASGKTLATSLDQVAKTASTGATDFAGSFLPALQSIIGIIAGGKSGGAPGAGGILSTILSLFGGARAGGGDVMPGRAYVVGEKRPELFVPRTGGKILPRLDMMRTPRLAGMGAARQHVAVAVTVDASPLLLATTDARAGRISARGDAGTLKTAARQAPGRISKFGQLGT